jgi:hypothetical protein
MNKRTKWVVLYAALAVWAFDFALLLYYEPEAWWTVAIPTAIGACYVGWLRTHARKNARGSHGQQRR